MDLELIGNLIRLRYKLLWANTRTRNGKIALFFAGYLLLVMVIALLAAGGVGAGMAAIRSGKGTILAGVLLTGIFAQALLASVILGFGMATIFSETELRRYPLRAAERRVTRHFIGIADPFWILFFVLDLGLAFGLYLFGAGGFWYGLVAVVLLFGCNYIAARVLAMLVQRLTSKRFGSMIMLAAVVCVGMVPALLEPVLKKNPALVVALKRIWQTTPPAAAGIAMTHMDLSALQALRCDRTVDSGSRRPPDCAGTVAVKNCRGAELQGRVGRPHRPDGGGIWAQDRPSGGSLAAVLLA